MWLYQVLVFILMLSYSVSGYVCDCNKKNEKLFHIFDSELSWHEALLNCSSQKLKLATIHSQEEQDMFDAAITKTGTLSRRFWIGGADLLKQGDYIWFSTGEPMMFKLFYPYQPNSSQKPGNTEHCVEAFRIGESSMWNDMFCDMKLPFVCYNSTVERNQQNVYATKRIQCGRCNK